MDEVEKLRRAVALAMDVSYPLPDDAELTDGVMRLMRRVTDVEQALVMEREQHRNTKRELTSLKREMNDRKGQDSSNHV